MYIERKGVKNYLRMRNSHLSVPIEMFCDWILKTQKLIEEKVEWIRVCKGNVLRAESLFREREGDTEVKDGVFLLFGRESVGVFLKP